MSDEIGNIILNEINGLKNEVKELRNEVQNEIKGLRDEVQNEIKGLRNEVQNEIKGLRDEIQEVRDELKSEIKEVKTELRDFKEETNKRFDVLENELMRNSEQHVAMNIELNEIKEREQKIIDEIKARDEIFMEYQAKVTHNSQEIRKIKEKLAM